MGPLHAIEEVQGLLLGWVRGGGREVPAVRVGGRVGDFGGFAVGGDAGAVPEGVEGCKRGGEEDVAVFGGDGDGCHFGGFGEVFEGDRS